MKDQQFVLSLLLVTVILATFAGCTTQQQPSPMILITSPQNGAIIPAGSIPVTVQVSNFTIVDRQGQPNVAGEGHIHFYLDVGTVPQTPGQPAIPSDKNVQWAHVSGSTYTFTNVTPGMHRITVQLVNNDHTPLIPLVYQVAVVTVAGLPTTPAGTTIASTTIPTIAVPATTMQMPTMITLPPTTTVPQGTVSPSGAGNTVHVNLTAHSIAFDQSIITVPAGSTVVMIFNNTDFGVTHNFALYTDQHATTRIFVGDFITGPKTVTYTFTAPSPPGTYFFRCDVHPLAMTGTFITT